MRDSTTSSMAVQPALSGTLLFVQSMMAVPVTAPSETCPCLCIS